MDLHTLMGELEHYKPELYISNEAFSSFKFAKLLTEGEQILEPEVLYLGTMSALSKKLPLPCHAKVLCTADDAVIALEDMNFNLVLINERIEVSRIFNEIHDIMAAHYHFIQGSEILLDTLIHGKGIQHIIDIGSQILGNPITVGDPASKLIAHSYCFLPGEDEWNEHLKNGYMPVSVISSPEFLKMHEQVNRSSVPVLLNKAFNLKRDSITGKVMINNSVVAYLSVHLYNRPFQKKDIEFVALLCDVISSEMQKERSDRYAKGSIHESILVDLLKGNIKNSRAVEERIKLLNLNLKDNLYVIAVDLRHSNTEAIQMNYLLYMLENMVPRSKAILYNDNIVILVNSTKEKLLNKNNIKFFMDFLNRNSLFGGISRSFNNPLDISYYYKQSLKAIDLGMRNNKREVFFSYDEYVLFHLLDVCSDHVNLKEFCHPSLLKLIEYDSKNNSNFTYTLYIYLLNKGNQAESANILRIHRSTMIYRFEKIQSIMDINLSDSHTMNYLYLSFNILKFIDKENLNTLFHLS